MICPTCGFENSANTPQCASCATPLPASMQTGHTQGNSPVAVYTAHLPKGVRLQGNNYAVGEVLGQGGFGITYKGGDLSLRRYVALKEFFPQGCARQGSTVAPGGTLSAADYAGVKAKFVEEARTLARFNDPGIVRVYGVFEENNTAYMVMEFLEGQTLSARMTEKGALGEAEVVEIAQKVGGALKVVHESGLIHRDIKPDNICLTKEGRVVLIDFGTARSFASGKTVQHTTLLTPGYAPLEQYGNQARFGAYTDIYALGATLYHALTGQVPPQATDRATGVELKPPHILNLAISQSVSSAIVKALEVQAAQRPQSISEFLQLLKFKPLTPTSAPLEFQPDTASSVPSSDAGSWAVPQTSVFLPPGVPIPIEESWFHSLGGQEVGPMTRATMQGLVRGGIVKPDTMIWRTGFPAWIPAGQSEWSSQLGASAYNERTPYHGPQETGFDRAMISVPAWVWRTIWLSLFLLLAGRITLGIVRYKNGSRDFGKELAAQVLETPEGTPLREADLQLGDSRLDLETLTRTYNSYVGKVRYQDGDAGDISLDVTERGWLYEPEKFDFRFTPTDFGGVMSGDIRSDLNQRIQPLVTAVLLHRETRTHYSGSFTVRGYDVHNRISNDIPGGSVDVVVTGFDAQGAPANWSYSSFGG